MVLLVMFAAYALQVRYSPYMSEKERKEVVEANHERILFDNDGNKSRVLSERAIQRQRTLKLGTHEDLKRTRVAAKYLFNYNTVDAVLLGCAVLVNTFGIMFESSYLEKGSSDYKALTAMTLVVIIASISYYAIVLWTEVRLPHPEMTVRLICSNAAMFVCRLLRLCFLR